MEEDWSIYSGDAARDGLVQDAMGKIGPGKPVIIINLLRFREVSTTQAARNRLTANSSLWRDRTPTTKASPMR